MPSFVQSTKRTKSKSNEVGKWLGIGLCVLALFLFFQHFASASKNTYTFGVMSMPSSAVTTQQTTAKTSIQNAQQSPTGTTASDRIQAGHSWDPNQYYTSEGLNYWSYRACSSFSFWSTFNAWGSNIPKVGDVLAVQIKLGSIGSGGIWIKKSAYTDVADYYNFNSDYSDSTNTRSLDQVIAIANSGYPVIVGISGNVYGREYNKPYYQTEWLDHVFVVTGGNASNVDVVDSSKFNLTSIKYKDLTGVWSGRSFVVWPKNHAAPKL